MDLLTMSFSAAVMIAAIVILRALLIDRLPKTTFLILWAVVLLRRWIRPPVKQKKSLQRLRVRKVLPQQCSRASQPSSRRRQKKQSLQSPCRWSRRP